MNKRVTGTTYERVDTISAWFIEGGHLNQLMELAPKLNRTLTPDEKRDLQNLIFLIVTNATECGELGGDL
jgi:hypothetical protein